MNSTMNPFGSKPRGFAAMPAELQRRIAKKGGVASHECGRAHEWTKSEAIAAGSKGGQTTHERGKLRKWTSEEARDAGRLGGMKAHRNGTAHRLTREEASAAGKKGATARWGKRR